MYFRSFYTCTCRLRVNLSDDKWSLNLALLIYLFKVNAVQRPHSRSPFQVTCPEAFDGLVHHKNKVKVKLSRGNKLPFRSS